MTTTEVTISQIRLEVEDAYDPNTFDLEDHVTIISYELQLSGAFRVKRIERSMKDPEYARLELANRTEETWEDAEGIKRIVVDLSKKL